MFSKNWMIEIPTMNHWMIEISPTMGCEMSPIIIKMALSEMGHLNSNGFDVYVSSFSDEMFSESQLVRAM